MRRSRQVYLRDRTREAEELQRDRISSVLRRLIIDALFRLSRLDGANPLLVGDFSEKVGQLVEQNSEKMRDWRQRLALGELNIRDFNVELLELLGKFSEESNVNSHIVSVIDRERELVSSVFSSVEMGLTQKQFRITDFADQRIGRMFALAQVLFFTSQFRPAVLLPGEESKFCTINGNLEQCFVREHPKLGILFQTWVESFAHSSGPKRVIATRQVIAESLGNGFLGQDVTWSELADRAGIKECDVFDHLSTQKGSVLDNPFLTGYPFRVKVDIKKRTARLVYLESL